MKIPPIFSAPSLTNSGICALPCRLQTVCSALINTDLSSSSSRINIVCRMLSNIRWPNTFTLFIDQAFVYTLNRWCTITAIHHIIWIFTSYKYISLKIHWALYNNFVFNEINAIFCSMRKFIEHKTFSEIIWNVFIHFKALIKHILYITKSIYTI